jgi:AcrR family transcriptional regulator
MTQHPPATRGPGAAHDQRRRDILEAVFAIVEAQGAGQVTVRNVATAAGISAGRVQHYFPTKDALLSAAFTAINETGTERVQQRLTETGTDDREGLVAAILIELIPADEEHRRLVRVAQAFEVYALTRPELQQQLAEGYSRLIALVAGLLPPRGDQDSPSAARELIALANGLGWLVITGTDTPGSARRTVLGRIRQLFADHCCDRS